VARHRRFVPVATRRRARPQFGGQTGAPLSVEGATATRRLVSRTASPRPSAGATERLSCDPQPRAREARLAAQKKGLVSSERNNYKRAWYWRRVAPFAARRFTFIDECGSSLALTRLYGRAPAGKRVTESVPRNYGQQTSIISALGLCGPTATFTVEGAVDTDIFNVYVEQILGPTIEAGDILILDNLSAHRASRIEAVAAARGATVIWLAPYSPDFSPIELMWSKIKSYLRAAKARTREELEQSLVAALRLVTSEDCAGWFSHCGYQVASN